MKIAFFGRSGSGKDYLIRNVLEPKGYVRLSFSDQLKKISKKIFPWIEEDYPPELKEKPINIITSTEEKITKSPREIWLSLNCLRNIEDNIFIRMLQETLSLMSVKKIVISDVRTKNEYEWCKKNGFIFLKIVSPKPFHKENDFDKQQDNFQYDYIFENKMNGYVEFKEFFERIENENE